MSDPISREALLRVANLVRPALATQAYIPILTNIYFDGASACAYNDISAIMVRCPLDIDCCLPGDLLIKTLNSLSAKEVLATQDNNHVVVAAGRSKVKLPALPSQDFPFDMKSGNAIDVVITNQMLKGIGLCLTAVSNDPTHPAQMGVTMEDVDGKVVFYSTDNTTLSSYRTDDKIKLPGNVPIIIPTFFCQQLITLAAAFPGDVIDLLLLEGAVLAKFGDQAELFTKLLVDLEPLDIGRMIGRYSTAGKGDFQDIPTEFDAALDRALLILSSEVDKATKITASKGHMRLYSMSNLGESTDTLPYKDDVGEFLADPSMLSRGAKVTDKILLTNKVVIMSGDKGRFTHLIAHCTV